LGLGLVGGGPAAAVHSRWKGGEGRFPLCGHGSRGPKQGKGVAERKDPGQRGGPGQPPPISDTFNESIGSQTISSKMSSLRGRDICERAQCPLLSHVHDPVYIRREHEQPQDCKLHHGIYGHQTREASYIPLDINHLDAAPDGAFRTAQHRCWSGACPTRLLPWTYGVQYRRESDNACRQLVMGNGTELAWDNNIKSWQLTMTDSHCAVATPLCVY
jgi:hypothetical protein